MSTATLETTLARLYTDEAFRERFLRNPAEAIAPIALSEAERGAILGIDRDGLVLAAASYARKREGVARARADVARTRARRFGWLAIAQRVARWRAR